VLACYRPLALKCNFKWCVLCYLLSVHHSKFSLVESTGNKTWRHVWLYLPPIIYLNHHIFVTVAPHHHHLLHMRAGYRECISISVTNFRGIFVQEFWRLNVKNVGKIMQNVTIVSYSAVTECKASVCVSPWGKAIPVTGRESVWDVEAPMFSSQSAHRWRWGQPHAPADLYG
jgi:hypothetical protein